MIEVTFTSYEPALKKSFTNVKTFKDMEGATLFAKAMNWTIESWMVVRGR
jgi:hypothetical protein